MQKMIVLLACIFISFSSFAKIWRVNNNAGVITDFTTFQAVMQSASVVSGDTVHIEASNIAYLTGNLTLTKRLVVIGIGYLLNPADATYPGNIGLQYATQKAELNQFAIGAAAAGSKFIGLQINYININAGITALNIAFENVFFLTAIYMQSSGGE